MSQFLPMGDFQWVSPDANYDVSDDSKIGYILEVDLDYPSHLHDKHNDLSFCPEHSKPHGSKQPKLFTTLYPKKNYIIHYRNLKQTL